MKPITIGPQTKLHGAITIPGDKSISHRAAILSAAACGKTTIKNFLFADDCLVTLKVLRALGCKINLDKKRDEVTIISKGYFRPSASILNMGESGTSARVLLGLLSAQPFVSRMTGAPSLMRRPMARVIEPLKSMGAHIKAKKIGKDVFLPMEVLPAHLRGIRWKQKVASAQVKSALLLAGLFAEGKTVIEEPTASRDHTERMLKLFMADIQSHGSAVTIEKSPLVTPKHILIPGDISSAAFFIVAALLIKNAKVLLKNVGINPTRSGILRVLRRMGGCIKVINKRDLFEPTADIEVSTSQLRGTVIKSEEIPSLIDELPILMVAASKADGKTIIEGAQELRVKETDRIDALRSNLMKLGVNIRVRALKEKEIIEINGEKELRGAFLRSFSDHRTAMSMVVAGSAAQGASRLDDISCVTKSFPEFLATFKHLFK